MKHKRAGEKNTGTTNILSNNDEIYSNKKLLKLNLFIPGISIPGQSKLIDNKMMFIKY